MAKTGANSNDSLEISLKAVNDSIYRTKTFIGAQYEFVLEKEKISAGLSYDAGEVNPALKYTRQLSRERQVYISVARSVEYPDFQDTYASAFTTANVNLKPAVAQISAESGFHMQFLRQMNMDISANVKKTADFISWDESAVPKIFTANNIGKIVSGGIQLRYSWQPVEEIKVEIKYGFDKADQIITYFPGHTGNLKLNYLSKDWDMALNTNIVSQRYYKYGSGDALKGYALLDVKVMRNITEWLKAYIKGNNLFNFHYERWGYYPLQGRFVESGVVFNF